MKNTDIDFLKLKENTPSNIQRGLKREKFFTCLRSYVIYPAALLCLLLGLIFTAEDGASYVFGASGIAEESTVSADTDTTAPNPETEAERNNITVEVPFILGIDDQMPLGLFEYYYLNRDVLPDDIYGFNYNLVPEGHRAIVPISLARESNGGKMYIKNNSKHELDADDYKDFTLPEYEETDEYTVLIVHTHGTEAYTPDGVLSDPLDDPYVTRSKNNEENVVSIGALMAEVFEKNGIRTLHHAVAIDATVDDFYDSYTESGTVIRRTLRKYPSIKYVFDIHRDGLELSSGEKAKVICAVDGKRAAQVMSVIGSDTLYDHPNWEENLAFAVKLQRRLEDNYTDFCRPINVKQNTYNQDYGPLSLLLEIGTDGNTLEEARYSAEILAGELADLIKNG
ncbi:MAG: stage II sporulation protein P [Clostridia bacterium]|nr:stage II sporulation protein P [Clostridia bacterium]